MDEDLADTGGMKIVDNQGGMTKKEKKSNGGSLADVAKQIRAVKEPKLPGLADYVKNFGELVGSYDGDAARPFAVFTVPRTNKSGSEYRVASALPIVKGSKPGELSLHPSMKKALEDGALPILFLEGTRAGADRAGNVEVYGTKAEAASRAKLYNQTDESLGSSSVRKSRKNLSPEEKIARKQKNKGRWYYHPFRGVTEGTLRKIAADEEVRDKINGSDMKTKAGDPVYVGEKFQSLVNKTIDVWKPVKGGEMTNQYEAEQFLMKIKKQLREEDVLPATKAKEMTLTQQVTYDVMISRGVKEEVALAVVLQARKDLKPSNNGSASAKASMSNKDSVFAYYMGKDKKGRNTARWLVLYNGHKTIAPNTDSTRLFRSVIGNYLTPDEEVKTDNNPKKNDKKIAFISRTGRTKSIKTKSGGKKTVKDFIFSFSQKEEFSEKWTRDTSKDYAMKRQASRKGGVVNNGMSTSNAQQGHLRFVVRYLSKNSSGKTIQTVQHFPIRNYDGTLPTSLRTAAELGKSQTGAKTYNKALMYLNNTYAKDKNYVTKDGTEKGKITETRLEFYSKPGSKVDEARKANLMNLKMFGKKIEGSKASKKAARPQMTFLGDFAN